MKFLAVAICGMALAGCGDSNRLEDACKSLVLSLSAEPGAVKFTESSIVRVDLHKSHFQSDLEQRSDFAPLSSAAKVYVDELYDSNKKPPVKSYIEVNYSAEDKLVSVGAKASCVFVVDGAEYNYLSSFKFRGKEYFGSSLRELFSIKGVPDKFDQRFSLK